MKSPDLREQASSRREAVGARPWRSVRIVAALLALASLPSGPAVASGEAFAQQEVLVEALGTSGEVVTDRVWPALEVLDDGRLVPAIDGGEVGGDWRVVLYFDQLLASAVDFHNAALQLASAARSLTRLGPVEIVLAQEGITNALPPTRDPEALEQALSWLRLRETSADMQATLRREWLDEIQVLAEPEVVDVSDRVQVERELLAQQRQQLLLWAAAQGGPGPKALFVIGSGFDDEPARFYSETAASGGWLDRLQAAAPGSVEPSVDALAQVLSVYQWTVLPYVPGLAGDVLLEESEEEMTAREEAEKTEVVFQDGRLVDRTTLGFDPTELLRRRRQQQAEEAANPVLLDPLTPLRRIAEDSGGELLQGSFQLTSLLERLGQRRRLVVESVPAENFAVRPLATTFGPGAPSAVLRARRWIADATPEIVTAIRASKILAEELDEGPLAISAAVQPATPLEQSRLIVKRDTRFEEQEDPEDLRVTIAWRPEDQPPQILHESVAGWSVSLLEEDGDGDPMLSVALQTPPSGLVVVIVEELASGLWGSAFASVVESAGVPLSSDRGRDSLLLPAPKTIHLLAPTQGFAMGLTEFETVISDRSVAQVDFFLDGEREAVRRSEPFSATLDLGSLPQPRRVEVVALDATGKVLGRDYLVVNEGSGVFGVRIIKPRANLEDGNSVRLMGPVDVEAEVEPRRGEGVDRVEFYWMDTLVATRYARPFRQRIVIPSDQATGFIRVVAYLDDGASSEDVVFVNSTGPSERLQVNLMELYVVVTDRRGRPVKDLPQNVFRVLEEGESQEIATFSDAGELPLTVGMVIDASASMFVKLPEVRFAAAEFLRGLATRRDRAFVVGFGNEPRLTRSTTSDLPAVIHSLDTLQPDGQTGIWKAMVYSLVQLQGVPGKKALIVYTDGADEDPDFEFRTCLRFARKVGVPVYVILSNNEIRRTEGKGLNVKGFLDRLESLTESVGGRVFLARVGEDLQDVYREIDEELRSQYVVGYYSRDTGGTEWRTVTVDVERSGYKARTIAGYYR